MLFQINGLQITNLQKASDDKLVKVDIIANHLTEDSDGETVLKEAFNDETIKEFLDIGQIDAWHDSKNPALSKEEKMKAIIGKPIAFRWENGKPVVTAQLTKSHPLVQAMLPHLEADNPVYAASIGGSKMVMQVRDSEGNEKRIIPKIRWDHLALAPCNSVINREPGVNVRLLQKAGDIIAEFNDMSSFNIMSGQIFGQEQELRKALSAPESVGDLKESPGGAVTKQSLEKGIASLTFSEDEACKLVDTIIGIKTGSIPMTINEYKAHFKTDEEFAEKSYRLFDKYFKKTTRSNRNMITKEELLQKGIDASEADKIISALEAQTENSSPLEALNKALSDDPEMDSLFKAKKGEGDEDEDDEEKDEEYDEKFMKKMKKYMKSKGKDDDDDDDEKGGKMFGKEMKKAIDDISGADGGVVEMADLSPLLSSMVETVQTMAKAISGLERKIEVISGQNAESYSLLAKAAAVTAETAEIVSGIGNAPVGRKGALVQNMEKAVKTVQKVDSNAVWSTLVKALNSGDMKAGAIGSKFESSGKRFDFLNNEEQSYVKELMTKEANS